MASAAQMKANKANAQSSTGPRTEEGKNKIRYNAFQHGAYATIALRPGEPLDEWTVFRGDYVQDKSPVGLPQFLCVEQAALAEFKLMRLPDFETYVPRESPGDYSDWEQDKLITGKQQHLLRCEMHLIRVRDKHLAQLRLHKKDKADAAKETDMSEMTCPLGPVAATIPVAVQPDPEADSSSPVGAQATESASDSPEERALREAIREESLKFYREQKLAKSGLSQEEIDAKIGKHLIEIGLAVDSPQAEAN